MKRFTETQKWEDPWFRKLSPEMKLLWQWLLDRCDNAGIIDPDIDLASFQIGYQYPINTLSAFGERITVLPSGKYFIPKFIAFQYGQLSRECKAHKPIFMSLQKNSIKCDSIGYPKGIDTLQEKETETDKEKETEIEMRRPLCTIEQAKAFAPQCRMTPEQAEHWWHTRNASGWTKGSTGGGAPRAITSWQSDMATSLSWVGESLVKTKSGNGPAKSRGLTSNDVGI